MDPNSEVGHYQLGHIYYSQQKYDEAIVQYRAAVRRIKGFNGDVSLARALEHAGQLDEAEKMLRELVKQVPNVWDTNNELAWVLSLKKQYDAAIPFFQEAERISPDAWLLPNIGALCTETIGKYDLAVKEGEIAVQLAPNDFYCADYLGDAYVLAKDYDSAQKMYRRAIEISSNNGMAHFDLGSVLLKIGKKAEGRAELTRALELKLSEEETKKAHMLLDQNP